VINTKNRRFITETGVEVPAVSSEQMKELDRIAMEETGPNLYQMMENAGRNLGLFIIDLLGRDWQNQTILILAGSGGNGGGGICAARHLANHGGKVFLCTPPSDMLSGVTLFQHKVFTATSGREISPDKLPGIGADIIVDAIIGYGLKSAPRGLAGDLIEWTNNTKLPVVSLDVPSGVDATTGDTPGFAVNAAYTVTLALPKTGLATNSAGTLHLADIGIPEKAFRLLGVKPYVNPFLGEYVIPISSS
jgi:NAD(P)H-hydrate epimerase